MAPAPADSDGPSVGNVIRELGERVLAQIKAVPGLDRLIEPMARNQPLALVLGAALAGALLVLTRPWRWLVNPALVAGLLPALATRTIRELPLDTWVQALGRYLRRHFAEATDEPTAGRAGS